VTLVPCKFLFLFFLLVFISACDLQKSAEQAKQECYKEGYTQGKVEGDKDGYDRGYKEGDDKGYAQGKADGNKEGYDKGYAEGFERVYPGSKHQHSGFLGWLQKIFSMFGVFVIPLALIVLVFHLIGVSRSDNETAGKILMFVLGSIVAIWLMNAFGISETLKGGFLSPPSETIFGWFFIGGISALLTFTVFILAEKL
jgi:amino acid transporter